MVSLEFYTGVFRFQFSQAAKRIGDVLEDLDCLPIGFVLSDPSHYKSAEAKLLYAHWIKRQNMGQRPLHFKHTKANGEIAPSDESNWKGDGVDASGSLRKFQGSESQSLGDENQRALYDSDTISLVKCISTLSQLSLSSNIHWLACIELIDGLKVQI